MKIGIIADDITGLNAIGGIFKTYGFDFTTVMNEKGIDSDSHSEHVIYGYDTNTRTQDITRKEVSRKIQEAAQFLESRGTDLIFKQSDSSGYGHIALESIVLAEYLNKEVIVYSPACPGKRRLTKNGRQYLFDTDPFHTGIHLSDLWKEFPDWNVRSNPQKGWVQNTNHEKKTVLIPDAETDRELDSIIQIFFGVDNSCLVGSVGLAYALARYLWLKHISCTHPVLVVAGSMRRAARQQLELLDKTLFRRFSIHLDRYDREDTIMQMTECIQSKKSCVILTDASHSVTSKEHHTLTSELDSVLHRVYLEAGHLLKGFAVLGGATTEVLLRNVMNIQKLEIRKMITEANIGSWAYTPDSCVPVVTQAGAWGQQDSLLKGLEWISGEHTKREKKQRVPGSQ